MVSTLFALLALISVDGMAAPSPAPQATASTPKVDRYAGRPQARIAFAREVTNFQVKRDGYDDILFLETRRDRWFRSEINCFGIDDPRDAQGLLPLDHIFGLDGSSRIALVGFGHGRTECRLNGLIELTPEEAVEQGLIRRRPTPTPKASPKANPTS
jgi:hypothetical protein